MIKEGKTRIIFTVEDKIYWAIENTCIKLNTTKSKFLGKLLNDILEDWAKTNFSIVYKATYKETNK